MASPLDRKRGNLEGGVALKPKFWLNQEERPPDFSPLFETAAVFIEADGKILLMQRHPDKPYGMKWGLPGGKLEASETPLQAAIREIEEETGIVLTRQETEEVGALHFRFEEFDFIFHMFFANLLEVPSVINDPAAHIEWCWIDLEETDHLPKISGADEAFKLFKSYRSKP